MTGLSPGGYKNFVRHFDAKETIDQHWHNGPSGSERALLWFFEWNCLLFLLSKRATGQWLKDTLHLKCGPLVKGTTAPAGPNSMVLLSTLIHDYSLKLS